MYRRYVFGALIPLLLAPHPRLTRLESAPKYEAMWYELVVKCTIKVTKALQQAIEVRPGGGGGARCKANLPALQLIIH